ncbi:MAG: SurA N-terminal domain-containing protein [Eggerthellaceae bacterium]|nr:SurA N-terminal domain-containing protein [Eggerthellaceae bacterium]
MQSLKKKIAVIVSGVFLVFGIGLLAFYMDNSGNFGLAGKVNEREIPEVKITNQIQNLRKSLSLISADKWKSSLEVYGYTPEKYRDEIFDTLANKETVYIAADEEGITASHEEIDQAYNNLRNKFSTEKEFEKSLNDSGYTPDSYRENCEYQILATRLREKKTPETDETDDMKTYLGNNYSKYNAYKRSSHILFNKSDENTAKDVLRKLKDGSLDWNTAVVDYSKDTQSTPMNSDRGWDDGNTYSMKYHVALAQLSKDALSDLVADDDGIHIIKCTNTINISSDSIESLNGFDSDFLALVEKDARKSKSEEKFDVWVKNYKEENCKVVKWSMPIFALYNVQLSSSDGTVINSSSDIPSNGTVSSD